MTKTDTDRIVDALDDVKRLLTLSLLVAGVKRSDVAKTLGVDPAVISRMIPKGAEKVKGESR